MDCLLSTWRVVLIACVTVLCGCASTQQPKYPAQLQMIIAQSAANSQTPVKSSASGAISVEQLLANVKSTANDKSQPAAIKSSGEQKVIHGRDSVPDWIFKGQSRNQQLGVGSVNDDKGNDALAKAQALTMASALATKPIPAKEINQAAIKEPIKPNQRKLQLQYRANELLPHQMQLLMIKQMVALQQMRPIKLVVGTSREPSSFARAVTAQARAKQLIKQLGEQNGIVVEYQPKIGDNIAIVTFQTRGS